MVERFFFQRSVVVPRDFAPRSFPLTFLPATFSAPRFPREPWYPTLFPTYFSTVLPHTSSASRQSSILSIRVNKELQPSSILTYILPQTLKPPKHFLNLQSAQCTSSSSLSNYSKEPRPKDQIHTLSWHPVPRSSAISKGGVDAKSTTTIASMKGGLCWRMLLLVTCWSCEG